MKIIKTNNTNELIFKKSRFLGFLFYVETEEQIENQLQQLKQIYKNATHYCYAYILDIHTFKYYDDGEPHSTAGLPIYNVLQNNNLIYTLAVVIRFYGGTKLGTGGLAKAYSSTIKQLIDNNELIHYIKRNTYEISLTYDIYDTFLYELEKNNGQLIKSSFEKEIIVMFSLPTKKIDSFQNRFSTFKIKPISLED